MEELKRDLSLLISINDDIATIKDNKQLFLTIFMKLRSFFHLQVAGISLLSKKKDTIGSVIGKLDSPSILLSAPTIWFNTVTLEKAEIDLHLDNPRILTIDAKLIFENQKEDKSKPSLEETLTELSINAILMVPMQTGGALIGFLIVPASDLPLVKEDQDYLLKIANLMASAISNAQAYEELKQKEKISEMQFRLLSDLVTVKDTENAFVEIAQNIDKIILSDYIALHLEHTIINYSFSIALTKESTGKFKYLPFIRNFSLPLAMLKKRLKVNDNFTSSEIFDKNFNDLCKDSAYFRYLKEKQSIKSVIILQYSYQDIGILNLIIGRARPFQWLIMKEDLEHLMFSHIQEVYFSEHELGLGLNILPPIGLILSNIFAFEEIKTLTKKLEQEKSYLLEEINLTHNFQEIIGGSPAIQKTLNKVKQVAPLDATVLIQGETGTGKELIARAVHGLSKRSENTFITVNCAALPAQLIESELFGHEKGSFTGAVEKKVGKFEVANGGTIFLDEIGELPLEIQAKLLRVLQEKEFERLGGKSTIHSDVRIVAATNRDLEKEVTLGKFRADLFFRLNVFPILVPPLRERAEDIPLLVKYFIDKYSKKVGKNVSSIRKTDMDLLMGYNWPGNIRELEHMTERAIIISGGTHLNFENLFNRDQQSAGLEPENFKTLEEMEIEHIVNALKAANGKVSGENSASQLLGINGKTLDSKMRKLKIKREISISAEKK